MINKIIHFSLHNRLVVLFSAVLITLAGLYISHEAEVDVFPDLGAPTVVVMTEAGGMAAEEVEQLVTFPIETAVNGAQGVRRVRSQSTNGFSVVWVEFDWNTNITDDRVVVSEKIAVVRESLPSTANRPMLAPQSSILGEVFIIGLTSDSTSSTDLRTLADWVLAPRLLSTGGVAQVSVLGGDVKEYQVLLDPLKMKHFNISLDEVIEATASMNLNTSGGVLNSLGKEYIVRGIVASADVTQMAQTVVKQRNGYPILLSDVATVTIGKQEPRMGAASINGKNGVLLTVTKQPSVNTTELTQTLQRVINNTKGSLPTDVKVHTDIFCQADFINASISNVKTSLFEGSLMVIVVLMLFLANVRATLISLVTIPLSLLISILVLTLLGHTLNTMSLGGMAIAIGSLVDDAIVDVENVWRHIRADNNKQLSLVSIIYNASREVRMPILNSTAIIIVSFVPLFFLSGMEGRMLIPLGIAFIVSLCASTLVALTLTPVLCSYLLRSGNNITITDNWLRRVYSNLLNRALDHKRLILSATTVLLLATIYIFTTLGSSFLPSFNEGSLTVNISTLPGVSLEQSENLGRQAEKLLLEIPEIKVVARKTGRAEMDEHALGINVSEMEAPFVLVSRSHEEFINDVRLRLSELRGVNVEIGQPISHRIDAMLSGTQASIAIKVFGSDLDRLFRIGNRIKECIENVNGITDLNVEQQIGRPQLEIVPRRNLMAKHGITPTHFSHFVSVNMQGSTVAQVYDCGHHFNLVVKTDPQFHTSPESVANLIIDCPDGEKIPLSAVADIRLTTGPNTINRENAERKVVVSANVSGRDLGSVVADINSRISSRIDLPEGYHIELGGQFENQQRASRILATTTIIAVFVIFLLLCMQFGNIRHSAIVLVNLPLALIGGVFALWVTSGVISIPSIIGFISLFGIATRGGMLLISHYNNLLTEQMPVNCNRTNIRQLILSGSADRLYPILMTTLTSALALIPLAIRGDLPGNEIQSPMAQVILGGLLTSTLLNLFIIPIIYEKSNSHI